MAVYLVCIAVSDFASQDATVASRSNRPVKVNDNFVVTIAI